ncbi:hypothetical protein [Roseateles saccharophilus]|uniref:hypothetical protein n=1 Tax=Roseateles saccharophilus TaxID=304 RepID=UPI00104B6887|nr:hypothetical protein [Roseateles saccharophilus]MDG0834234.1 hypothetical protein [Roseateles saccharophilus]
MITSTAWASLFGDPEITHTKVVEPRVAAVVDPSQLQIGLPMSLAVVGQRLVVGGSEGVAMVEAGGKVLWTLKLPPATARQVAADDTQVAFTSFDAGGVDRSATLANPLLGGELGARYEFRNATIGLIDGEGRLLWSVPSAEQAKLSPPALTAKTVGVVGVKTFAVYDRADGKPVAEPLSVYTNVFGLMEGLVSQFPSRPAVVVGDVFHLVRNNFYKRVSASGKEVESTRTVGLMTPLEYMPAGPVALGDRIIFGNSPSDGKQPMLLAAKTSGGFVWDERMDALVKTGMLSSASDAPMDLTVGGGNVYVATNFSVFCYSAAGRQQWRARNAKGGLFPSSLRGARYIGNSFERKVPVPKSFLSTSMLAATDERVYVATSYTGTAVAPEAGASAVSGDAVEGAEAGKAGRVRADAITVLDAKNGSYIESLWAPGQRILGMIVFGDTLAVTMGDGLKLLQLK